MKNKIGRRTFKPGRKTTQVEVLTTEQKQAIRSFGKYSRLGKGGTIVETKDYVDMIHLLVRI